MVKPYGKGKFKSDKQRKAVMSKIGNPKKKKPEVDWDAVGEETGDIMERQIAEVDKAKERISKKYRKELRKVMRKHGLPTSMIRKG